MTPAVPLQQVGLLVRVNVPEDRPPIQQEDSESSAGPYTFEDTWEADEFFGDPMYRKPHQVLRIGYQNIGGLSFTSDSLKDEIIRTGINSWEIDIFGMSKTNVDWRLIPDPHKLYFHTKSWWETSHISHAFNLAVPPISRKQFGGTALFSIGSTARRISGKGVDKELLGRWSWMLYKGKNNLALKIYSAYRPNPPSGPFSVYAQQ
jgi:hypothetical protein